MSEIKTKSQNWAVHGKDDVIALYEGTLTNKNFDDTDSKLGMEVELNLYKTDTLAPLTEEESAHFVCEGSRNALSINKEPSATTLEILTDPYKRGEFDHLIDQINTRFDDLWALGLNNQIAPSPFAYLPHVTPEHHHQTHNDRYIAFWIPPRPDLVDAYHSFLDPSIQVSISYRDYDHLLRIIRLSVLLEPFLILTTEADAGFYEGKQVDGSPRTRILKRRGRNGGVPEFYLKAKSGEELIDMHIDFTMNNKHVFVCFDHDGKLGKLPNDIWASFSELESGGFGPQNLLNYRQAQSESWRRTVNISEIRDTEGTLFGHRAEISSLFCTGLQHQRVSGTLLSYLISYCDDFYKNINALAKDFGIDMNNLYDCKTLLDKNFEHAHMHHGRYFDLPFGTKTMGEFAKGFADVIQSCLKGSYLEKHSDPLMHILTEGRPDWLVNRETFQTLDQQMAYMRALPRLAAEHPELISANSCADFTKDIITKITKAA